MRVFVSLSRFLESLLRFSFSFSICGFDDDNETKHCFVILDSVSCFFFCLDND